MEALTPIEKYRPARLLTPEEIRKIILELTGLKGITSIKVEKDFVSVEYYQQLLSSGLVTEALKKVGFPFPPKNKKPGIFRKLILKLGEENKKEFGGKPPKCCG